MNEDKISIRFFDDREVRALWDEQNAKWWFSVLDIVAVLRDLSDYTKNKPMKHLLTLILITSSLLCFSQKTYICLHEDSIYHDLVVKQQHQLEYQTSELNRLKSILFVNTDSISFLIGEIYYEDFILPYMAIDPPSGFHKYWPEKDIYDSIAYEIYIKHFKKSFFENSADSALHYFNLVKQTYPEKQKAMFFAIKQLECYVNNDSSSVELDSLISSDDYVPYWFLANLSENWKCDKSKNYLDLVFYSIIYYPDNRSSLYDLKEEPLYNKTIDNDHEIFRITYSPSFDNDCCLRIEKRSDKVMLFWKTTKKVYCTNEGIKSSGQKELSSETWNYFISLVEESDFKQLPNRYISNPSYSCMEFERMDGATWFYEYKSDDLYKAHYSLIPSRELEILTLYLLELADVKYKSDKWEMVYFKHDLILTNDLKYVITSDIKDTIISCLNKYIDSSIEENKCCCYFDSLLKFSKKGRIKTVRYPPEEDNIFVDIWWMYSDRKCRSQIKKALKNLDLSYLNLSEALYYFLELSYDEEEHIFKN